MTRSDRSAGPPAADVEGDAGEATLESFVAQLHSEGVEAGRREAEALVLAAEAEAEEIIRRARADAEALKATARKEAEAAGQRGRAELELAVRDAVLQLEAALTEVLRTLISRSVAAELSDPDALKPLLREVVAAYARADASARPSEFRVPGRAVRVLEDWWVSEVGDVLGGEGDRPELRESLEQVGFEYQVAGATVEVSPESVVDKLMELVRPGLQEVVRAVAADAMVEAVPAAETPPGLAGVPGRDGS